MAKIAQVKASEPSKLWSWVTSHWLNLLSLLLIPCLTVLGQQTVNYWHFRQANFDLALRINSDAEKYDAQAREWAFRQIAIYTSSVAAPLDVLSPELRAKLCLKPRAELLKPVTIADVTGVPDMKSITDTDKGTFAPYGTKTVSDWLSAGGVWGFSAGQYDVVTQLNQLISEVNAGCAAVQANKVN